MTAFGIRGRPTVGFERIGRFESLERTRGGRDGSSGFVRHSWSAYRTVRDADPVRALLRPVEPPLMRIEFDRDTCIGMFQCVAEWDAFEKDTDAGKANLEGSEEVEDGIFVREVPEDAELDAKFAARTCPVDAITVYDDDGEQLIP